MSFEPDRVELADYARILWKRKWMVILPSILVICSAVVALRFITPIYVASSVLEIKSRDVLEDQASVVVGERVRNAAPRRGADSEKLKKIRQQVRSRPFLEPVGRALGLDEHEGIRAAAERRAERMPDASLEELIAATYTKRLADKINVERAGIDLFKFTAEHQNPRTAYDIVNTLAKEYITFERTSGAEVTERTESFFEAELQDARANLIQAEQRLRNFQSGVTQRVLNQKNPVNGDNVGSTRLLIDEAGIEIRSLEGRISRGLERLPSELGGAASIEQRAASSRLTRLARELADAEVAQVSLTIRGTTGHTEVSRVRQDIFSEMRDRVERAFPSQSTSVQSKIGDVIFDRIVLRSVEARQREVRRLLDGFTYRASQKTDEDLELERREAEVKRLRKLVSSLEENKVQSEVKNEAQSESIQAKITILEPPEIPRRPDRPDKMRILMLALAAGPLLGIGVVVMTEYLDTSLKTVEEVEALLDVPVLGTVPKLAPSNTRSPSKRQRRRSGAASAVLILALGHGALNIASAPEAGPVAARAIDTQAVGENHV